MIRWKTTVAAALALSLVTPVAATAAPSEPDPDVLRSREVKLGDDALKAVCEPIRPKDPPKLTLDLFDDVKVPAIGEEAETSDDGDTITWRGAVDGKPEDDVVVTVTNACDTDQGNMVLSAAIFLDGRSFTMDSSTPGSVTISELKADEGHIEPDVGEAPELPPGYPTSSPATGPGDRRGAQKPCATKTVDLLALYTPGALADVGSAEEIENDIGHAVNVANTAYRNSGVNLRMRLVRAAEAIGYTEPSGVQAADVKVAQRAWSKVLKQVSDPLDGKLDEAFTERDNAGADLTTVIVSPNQRVGGVAYRPDPPEPAGTGQNTDLRNFFSLVGANRLDTTTLAHESGHNMGLEHDWFTVYASPQGKPSAKFPYDHGYAAPSKKWRTVMAYDIACKGGDCAGIPYFSSPRKIYEGELMGVAKGKPDDSDIRQRPADSVRMLNDYGKVVAGYRAEKTPAKCAAPNPAPKADLKVTGKVGKLRRGKSGTYTLKVTHTGSDVAASTTLKAKVPRGLKYKKAKGAKCRRSGSSVRCSLSTVPPSRTIKLYVKASKKAKGKVSSTVTVSSKTADPKKTNNRTVIRAKIA